VYIDLYCNKDVYSSDSSLEVLSWGKPVLLYWQKTGNVCLPQHSTDSRADVRQGRRHSSCRQPTLDMSATDIRSACTHLPTSVLLSVYRN